MFNTPVVAAAAKKATSATRWLGMVDEAKSSTMAEATPDDVPFQQLQMMPLRSRTTTR
jgi:hypothetical protein